jgi:hypothetical protein
VTTHADRYRIDWPGQRVVEDPAGRTSDPRNFGWGGSYVVYTEGHEDGECDHYAFDGTKDWPVVRAKIHPPERDLTGEEMTPDA